MANFGPIQFNPKTDLVLERTIDVPRDLVWKAWTTPEHLMPWFCPLPWKTVECQIDLRPGGIFRTVMQSPEGDKFPGDGCYLDVVKHERLIWTDALLPGFRPNSQHNGPFKMTAGLVLEQHGEGGTKYTAFAIHSDEEGKKKHEEMGFLEGWGVCADQLVAYIKRGMR